MSLGSILLVLPAYVCFFSVFELAWASLGREPGALHSTETRYQHIWGELRVRWDRVNENPQGYLNKMGRHRAFEVCSPAAVTVLCATCSLFRRNMCFFCLPRENWCGKCRYCQDHVTNYQARHLETQSSIPAVGHEPSVSLASGLPDLGSSGPSPSTSLLAVSSTPSPLYTQNFISPTPATAFTQVVSAQSTPNRTPFTDRNASLSSTPTVSPENTLEMRETTQIPDPTEVHSTATMPVDTSGVTIVSNSPFSTAGSAALTGTAVQSLHPSRPSNTPSRIGTSGPFSSATVSSSAVQATTSNPSSSSTPAAQATSVLATNSISPFPPVQTAEQDLESTAAPSLEPTISAPSASTTLRQSTLPSATRRSVPSLAMESPFSLEPSVPTASSSAHSPTISPPFISSFSSASPSSIPMTNTSPTALSSTTLPASSPSRNLSCSVCPRCGPVYFRNQCSAQMWRSAHYDLTMGWMDCWEFSCRQQCVEWSYCDVLPLDIPPTFHAELRNNLSALISAYRREKDSLNAYIAANVHSASDLTAAAYYNTAKRFEGQFEELIVQALIVRDTQTKLKNQLRSEEYQYEQGNASLVQHLTQELQNRNLSWNTRAEQYELALRTSPRSISQFRVELEGDFARLQRMESQLADMTAQNDAFDARYAAVMDYLNGLLDEIDKMEGDLMNMWFEIELLAVAESQIMEFLNKVMADVRNGRITVGCSQDAIVNVTDSAL